MKATTKDEAANIMLSMIGEAPITSPTTSSSADAISALSILDEVSKETQSGGWHFNREYEVTLTPDVNTKEILLPENALRVDVEPANSTTSGANRMDAVIRGKEGGQYYLYNKEDHTFEFSAAVKATIVYGFEWDELPEVVKNYVIKKAGRVFSTRSIGAADQARGLQEEEFQAMINMRNWDTEMADYSVFDHWDTYRIINRHGIPNSI